MWEYDHVLIYTNIIAQSRIVWIYAISATIWRKRLCNLPISLKVVDVTAGLCNPRGIQTKVGSFHQPVSQLHSFLAQIKI
jgi:hypothetical protein